MTQKTLDKKVEEELANARKYAEEGDATLMQTCLDLADTYNTQKADIKDKKESIEKVGYRNAVNVELVKARKYAEEGDALIMETCLDLADTYNTQKADIKDKKESIEKVGYRNAVNVELVKARKYAEEGDATLMQTCLDLADTYNTQKADIKDKKESIEKVGYRNAVNVELVKARKYAEEGDALIMETCLSLAKAYARYIKQDISTKVTEVKASVKKK